MRAAAFAGLALLAAACGGGTSAAGGTVTVFAAASLTHAFQDLGRSFESSHPGFHLTFEFAGSPTLVGQIQQGARADVFAAADQANMARAMKLGLTQGAPTTFARNTLEIAVAPGNPKHVASLADLARPDLTVVLAAPQVPAGAYAARALTAAGAQVRPKSLETDVESVLAKVELGEADAGIVYATDVKAAGTRVQGVEIPARFNITAAYPAVEVKHAPNPSGARAFLDYLASSAGRQTLERYGFTTA